MRPSPPEKRPASPFLGRGDASPFRPFPPGRPAEEDARVPASGPALPPQGQAFLDELLRLRLLSRSATHAFLAQRSVQLAECTNPHSLGGALVRAGLLTEYQVDRVLAGTTHGLVLGNYRVRERLGSGGMGIVFLAEHCLMQRRAAVKVLPVDEECPPEVRERFHTEMRGLADLHHPHIVLAYDAGELPPAGPNMPALVYLVMELVSGGDLEQYVLDHGPRPVSEACDWVRQAACGLQEAHDHHLIHRDVKPSNLMLTAQGQVKVGDFGLARQFCSRLTDPRSLLGSIDYVAPEQSHDPSAVGAEADIYGLGATLFWLLTGETPYPRAATLGSALRQLQSDSPRRLRSLCPAAPAELEELIERMMHRDPARRPAMPLNVMNALAPFAATTGKWDSAEAEQRDRTEYRVPSTEPSEDGTVAASPPRSSPVSLSASLGLVPSRAAVDPGLPRRVLLVDDDAQFRVLCRRILERLGCRCAEAADGEAALATAAAQPCDLVLLDLLLPDIHGYEVCWGLRRQRSVPNLKIIVISGKGDANDLAESLPRGADDYVPKPFEPRQLVLKVQHALQLKDAQDRADQLAGHLLLTNRQLEQSLRARVADVRQAQDALLFTMARMAESQDGETEGHLRRMQLYCRRLAEEAARAPPWAGLVDTRFLEQLERCVPLHDIGKIHLPDHVLLKKGRLTSGERALVETHPVIGDRILQALGRAHGQSLPFLGMASAVVRHHHERYDGQGYPDRLAGDAIPAAARLVAVADVYEALRRKRPYKPAFHHAAALQVMLEDCTGHFDPTLLRALRSCHGQFESIYRDLSD